MGNGPVCLHNPCASGRQWAGPRGSELGRPAAVTPSRFRLRPARVLRGLLIAVLALFLLPYAVAPFYRAIDPVSTPMIWRWITGARVERSWRPLGAIAPVLPVTVLAAEDARFCTHRGVDWTELRDVIDEAEDWSEVRGGSTITQQTAKNLFLWPGRSFLRKGLELPLALWIDLVLPKRRILEIYLNIAEWGPNIYGVEAAAQHHFGKAAKKLSRREAALLAVTLPNPAERNPAKPSSGMKRLAALIERRAAAAGDYVGCLD